MLRDLFSLFPAYAGVILCAYIFQNVYKSFPRIRGGDPNQGSVNMANGIFSPHTRG